MRYRAATSIGRELHKKLAIALKEYGAKATQIEAVLSNLDMRWEKYFFAENGKGAPLEAAEIFDYDDTVIELTEFVKLNGKKTEILTRIQEAKAMENHFKAYVSQWPEECKKNSTTLDNLKEAQIRASKLIAVRSGVVAVLEQRKEKIDELYVKLKAAKLPTSILERVELMCSNVKGVKTRKRQKAPSDAGESVKSTNVPSESIETITGAESVRGGDAESVKSGKKKKDDKRLKFEVDTRSVS